MIKKEVNIAMEPKAMTRKQMARNLGVCARTFNRMLRDAGIQLKSGLIIPKDQELIYSSLGYPPGYSRRLQEGK